MDQHTYVAGCLAYYAENYYEPGNPEDGIWEDCHYPEPDCLGGTATVKMLKQHHAVQGVLQSEEYQYPCIFGWERPYLTDELLPLYDKWRCELSRIAGKTAAAQYTPEQQQERMRHVARQPRPGNWEQATDERRQSVMTAITQAWEARQRPVAITNSEGSTVYPSLRSAAIALGVSHALVSLWLSGKKHSYRKRGLTVAWAD